MWQYEKRLQYPVNIKNPNPKLAQVIISQYGGPDGEIGASLRYLSQRYSMPYPELKAILTDVGIEDYFWTFRKIYKMAIKNGMRKFSHTVFAVILHPYCKGQPY